MKRRIYLKVSKSLKKEMSLPGSFSWLLVMNFLYSYWELKQSLIAKKKGINLKIGKSNAIIMSYLVSTSLNINCKAVMMKLNIQIVMYDAVPVTSGKKFFKA